MKKKKIVNTSAFQENTKKKNLFSRILLLVIDCCITKTPKHSSLKQISFHSVSVHREFELAHGFSCGCNQDHSRGYWEAALIPLSGLLHVGLLECAHEMSGEFPKNE